MANRPGIYKILNVINGKAYIGSSIDVPKRMSVHAWLLRKGKHHSPQLQRSWDRDGEATFSFAVIERCEKDQLLKREQIWINALQSYDDRFGYNVGMVAGTREGVPQPLSHVEMMRARLKGIPKSAEHRAKIGAANRGLKRTDAQRSALSEAVSLLMADPDRRAKQAIYGAMAPSQKGKVMSPESRAKMSDSHRARWEGVPRKLRAKPPSKARPKELHKKRGPNPGTPRLDKRSFPRERVFEIRAAAANGMSYSKMEEFFGMGRGPLHRIVTRKTYSDI